jgi:hypothetical protein
VCCARRKKDQVAAQEGLRFVSHEELDHDPDGDQVLTGAESSHRVANFDYKRTVANEYLGYWIML